LFESIVPQVVQPFDAGAIAQVMMIGSHQRQFETALSGAAGGRWRKSGRRGQVRQGRGGGSPRRLSGL
jgi:hypothetical protein